MPSEMATRERKAIPSGDLNRLVSPACFSVRKGRQKTSRRYVLISRRRIVVMTLNLNGVALERLPYFVSRATTIGLSPGAEPWSSENPPICPLETAKCLCKL